MNTKYHYLLKKAEPSVPTMREIEIALDQYGEECSAGNEYDNRRRIAAARKAVLDMIKRRTD
jgi:hypothetical protein